MKKFVYATVDFGNEQIYHAWPLWSGPQTAFLVVLQKRNEEKFVIRLDHRQFARDKSVGPEEEVYPGTLKIKDAYTLKTA
jgi:hypothetical protein